MLRYLEGDGPAELATKAEELLNAGWVILHIARLDNGTCYAWMGIPGISAPHYGTSNVG
jgi:hypothetical protein